MPFKNAQQSSRVKRHHHRVMNQEKKKEKKQMKIAKNATKSVRFDRDSQTFTIKDGMQEYVLDQNFGGKIDWIWYPDLIWNDPAYKMNDPQTDLFDSMQTMVSEVMEEPQRATKKRVMFSLERNTEHSYYYYPQEDLGCWERIEYDDSDDDSGDDSDDEYECLPPWETKSNGVLYRFT